MDVDQFWGGMIFDYTNDGLVQDHSCEQVGVSSLGHAIGAEDIRVLIK